MNGSLLPWALGLETDINTIPFYEPSKGKGTRVAEGFHYLFYFMTIADSLFSWKMHCRTPSEIIKKKINVKCNLKKEKIFQLGI